MKTLLKNKNVKRSSLSPVKITERKEVAPPHHAELKKIHAKPIVNNSFLFRDLYLSRILIPRITEIVIKISV